MSHHIVSVTTLPRYVRPKGDFFIVTPSFLSATFAVIRTDSSQAADSESPTTTSTWNSTLAKDIQT